MTIFAVLSLMIRTMIRTHEAVAAVVKPNGTMDDIGYAPIGHRPVVVGPVIWLMLSRAIGLGHLT